MHSKSDIIADSSLRDWRAPEPNRYPVDPPWLGVITLRNRFTECHQDDDRRFSRAVHGRFRNAKYKGELAFHNLSIDFDILGCKVKSLDIGKFSFNVTSMLVPAPCIVMPIKVSARPDVKSPLCRDTNMNVFRVFRTPYYLWLIPLVAVHSKRASDDLTASYRCPTQDFLGPESYNGHH